MNLLKYCVNNANSIQHQPKKRRRCDSSCNDHFFSLTKIDKPKNHNEAVVNFCPKIPRGNQPPENTYPQFNNDRLFYTDGFILGIDRRQLEANRTLQHTQHIRLVSRTCQKNYRVNFPKPNDNHTLCSVCKINYGSQYYAHILSDYHKMKIKENTYNKCIEQLSMRFKHMHPQKTEELASPFRFPDYIIKNLQLDGNNTNPVGLDYPAIIAPQQTVIKQMNQNIQNQQVEEKKQKRGKRAKKSSKQALNNRLQPPKIDQIKVREQQQDILNQDKPPQIKTDQTQLKQLNSVEQKEQEATVIEQKILGQNQEQKQVICNTINIQAERIKNMKRRFKRYTQKRSQTQIEKKNLKKRKLKPATNSKDNVQTAEMLTNIEEKYKIVTKEEQQTGNLKQNQMHVQDLNEGINQTEQINETQPKSQECQNIQQKQIDSIQQLQASTKNENNKTQQFKSNLSPKRNQQQISNNLQQQSQSSADVSCKLTENIEKKQPFAWQKEGISLKQFLQRQLIRKLSNKSQKEIITIKQSIPVIQSTTAQQIPRQIQQPAAITDLNNDQDSFIYESLQIEPYEFQIDPDSEQIQELNQELLKLAQQNQWNQALSLDYSYHSYSDSQAGSCVKRQRDENEKLQQQKITKRKVELFKPQSMFRPMSQSIQSKKKVVIEISSSDISSESDFSNHPFESEIYQNPCKKINFKNNFSCSYLPPQKLFHKPQKSIEQKSPQTWCTTTERLSPKRQSKTKFNRKKY